MKINQRIFFVSWAVYFSFGFFVLLTSTLSCTGRGSDYWRGDYRRGDRVSQVLRDRYRRDSQFRGRCDQSNITQSEEISIDNLEFVDSHNVGQYVLEGLCTVEDALIYIRVNGYPIDYNPKCDRGRWKTTLNLAPIADLEKVIVFDVTVNVYKSESGDVYGSRGNDENICREVRVAFLGPANYVPITSLGSHQNISFYVMKYEAKLDRFGDYESRHPYDRQTFAQDYRDQFRSPGYASNRSPGTYYGNRLGPRAIPIPEGRPISGASYQQAVEFCTNNGSRYDLMKNSHWQNIALSIESAHINWAQGDAAPTDHNELNCGVFRGAPQEASLYDDDDCAINFCEEGWDKHRRTHFLSNHYEGPRIWDICGNVGELMKDRYQVKYSQKGYIYELTSQLKKDFGPKRAYSMINANRRSNNWNLGYANLKSDKNLIIRGLPGRDAGVFSVDITRNQDEQRGTASDVGFRCVYVP